VYIVVTFHILRTRSNPSNNPNTYTYNHHLYSIDLYSPAPTISNIHLRSSNSNYYASTL
jgi:hypothetical protein